MTKRRRRWLLASAYFMLLSAGAFALWAWDLANSARTTDTEKIAHGMSRREVSSILGDRISMSGPVGQSSRLVIWEVADGCIWVEFDGDELVTGKAAFYEGEPLELFLRRIWSRVREKLGP